MYIKKWNQLYFLQEEIFISYG
uniref:Uncharacterized protein n=1 Tax=Arundo donax TaxID=35708 RepID=A0A0A9ENM0_ARUDO